MGIIYMKSSKSTDTVAKTCWERHSAHYFWFFSCIIFHPLHQPGWKDYKDRSFVFSSCADHLVFEVFITSEWQILVNVHTQHFSNICIKKQHILHMSTAQNICYSVCVCVCLEAFSFCIFHVQKYTYIHMCRGNVMQKE